MTLLRHLLSKGTTQLISINQYKNLKILGGITTFQGALVKVPTEKTGNPQVIEDYRHLTVYEQLNPILCPSLKLNHNQKKNIYA